MPIKKMMMENNRKDIYIYMTICYICSGNVVVKVWKREYTISPFVGNSVSIEIRFDLKLTY